MAKFTWEITYTKGKTLIPRVMDTNIMVYVIYTDISMDSSRRNQRNNNNTQHSGRLPQVTNEGLTRVRTAIMDQNRELLKDILNHEPDLINCTDEKDGLTPLSFAAYHGYSEVVHFFLKEFHKSMKNRNKDDDESYPIHMACLGGHIEVLKMFHSKDSKSVLVLNKRGETVMHLAAGKRGNKLKEVVSYLLSLPERRKLIDKKDENGNTPCMLAKNNGNHEIQQIITRSMQYYTQQN